MYSMTGYGKGEYRQNGVELTVEVKSVNNRFLDLTVKSPRIFLSEEEEIRSAVRKKVSRGHIDVFVNYIDRRERKKSYFVDAEAAKAYRRAATLLKNEIPSLQDDTTLSFYLRLPDVVRAEETEGLDEELKTALYTALECALDNLVSMRKAEGERLKKDLLSRLDTIAKLREEIALRAPLVAEEYRKKITDRMQELLIGKADENRILTEAAVFSDKCNIDEELTRLSCHIASFLSIVEEETAGRKLDFLVQEFNRECNTVCSKSNDAPLTKAALQMKNELEKIREQIQNLE